MPRSIVSSLALGQRQLGKSALSAITATLIDYSCFNAVLHVAANLALATFVGALMGAVANFTLNRRWVFPATSAHGRSALHRTKTHGCSAWRYAIVSGSSACLNTGLIALIATVLPTQLTWWLVRLSIFVLWNHPMQRDWVFSKRD